MKKLAVIIGLFLLAVLAGCAAEPAADGGVNTRTGELVTEEEPAMRGTPAVLTFYSFDGGGPEYAAEIDDPALLSCAWERIYDSPEHENEDGAGYSVVFTFTGLRPGETQVRISSRSPIAGNGEYLYSVTVDEELNVAAAPLPPEGTAAPVRPAPVLVLEVGERRFYASLEDNDSARAFIEQLSPEAIEVEMRDYGGFEKVGPLPWALPQNDEEITTQPGDVILYQGDQITVYYGQNTWSLTRLARIGNVTGEELLEALGDGAVTIRFWLEWSE